MKVYRKIIYIITIICFNFILLAQESSANKKDVIDSEVETSDISHNNKNDNKNTKLNVNLDSKLLYGQYDNVLVYFSLIQNFDKFTYQFNSDFRRSNDYGYKNSSYYDSSVGLTGKADINEVWKLLPEIEIDNESHGMFDNSFFRREEKDRVFIDIKNEFKKNPHRFDLNIGFGHQVHRLEYANTSQVEKNSLYKLNGEFGWELIWSASNTFRMKNEVSHYFYVSKDENDDTDFHNELVLGFKVTEYFIFQIGTGINWNRDKIDWSGFAPFGILSISTTGVKHTSIELTYTYDLKTFRPENFNFNHNYIMPTYGLPPGDTHNIELKAGLDFKFQRERKFYLERIKLRGTGKFEANNNFYNYYSLIPQNVLTASTLNVMMGKAKIESAIVFSILSNGSLELGANYEYSYYYANKNITYRPEHAIGTFLKLSIQRWEFEWENTLKGKVFVEPNSDHQLKMAVFSTATVQFQIVDSFYLHAMVDNLYNMKFSYREGYPEPGIVFMGGIRIVI